MKRAIVSYPMCLPLVLLATACGARSSVGLPPVSHAADPDQIVALIVTPGARPLRPGSITQFQAMGQTLTGGLVPASVLWTATGGTITPTGRYTAGATPGHYRLIATYVGGATLADTALVTVADAGAGPVSCTVVYEDNSSSLSGDGLFANGIGPMSVIGDPLVQAALVTPDLSAPASPPTVLRLSFLPGWMQGTGNAVAIRRPLTADYYSLYLSFWFKLEAGWPGPDLGPDVAILLGSSVLPGGQEVTVNLGRMVAGQLIADLRLAGLDRPFGGTTSPLLTGNVGPTPGIGAGAWHRFELRVTTNGLSPADDGTIEWSLDGQAVGAYSGLGFFTGPIPAIRQLGWGATPPVAALASTEQVSIDHWFVSGGTSAPAIGTGEDWVVLAGDTPPASTTTVYTNPTTLLLDMRRNEEGGDVCHNDHGSSGTALIGPRGYLRHRRDCRRDEIVVFSVEDAAVLDQGACESGTIWTDALGETVTEPLGVPPIKVPLAIWTTNSSPCATSADPTADVDQATVLYNGHAAGVTFFVHSQADICGNPADRTALGFSNSTFSASCARLTKPPSHTPGMINVYYVPMIDGGSNGIQCRSVDPTIILIAKARNSTTLAHELGHAFGLEHTGDDDGQGTANRKACYVDLNGLDLIGPANLMWASGIDKQELTLGQVFRVNFDSFSGLNVLGFRVGPTRPCETPHSTGVVDIIWRTCTPASFYAQSRVDALCPAVSHSW